MKIKVIDKVICRTPAFCVNAKIADVLDELKLKIRESSPAFFEFIMAVKADELNRLNEKTRFTLWKYFNRAKYRSTPFGSFAAITLANLSATGDRMVIEKKLELSHYIDWSYKESYLKNLEVDIGPTATFLSNSSIYFTGNEIRYLKLGDGVHALVAVNNLPELNLILNTCRDKTPGKAIYELMQMAFEMDRDQTAALLIQLVNMQLLSTPQLPNITGMDYFERLKIDVPKSSADYIIAHRRTISGGMDNNCLKHLPELVDFLSQHLKSIENNDLTIFKRSFLKRFEHQEVSLAVIMDPEIGLGYGGFAQQHGTNPLVTEIKQAKFDQHQDSIAYGELHAFLLNKIVDGQRIELEEFETNIVKQSTSLPNTFSFVLHPYRNQPVIASAGGCTANALIGRFTMANMELENFGREISAFEMRANPGIAFFDIAYQAENRVDNVNRRKALYATELPILTWSDMQNPLDFADIMVSVHNNEVVLRSNKLNQRLIPRIPSAYNYTRSDLAAYRFLCDIQHQGLCTNLTFRLQDLFPKLQFYPRVSYKGIIVSPAMWKIPAELYRQRTSEQLSPLKDWLQKKNIDFRIKAGHGDHTLCFDPGSPDDLWALLIFCKQQQGDIYITEALISESDCVYDENGGLYLPQYIVNYGHEEQIYTPLATAPQIPSKQERIKLPGGDWLYFELYSHPAKANQLLLTKINPVLKSHRKLIKKWFFIRYNDPSSHLRLRLHLKNRSFGFVLIEALKAIAEPDMESGRLADFKIKTYFRETERYGARRMDKIEQFFNTDSRYMLSLLARSSTDNQLIASSLNLLKSWLAWCLPDLNDQIKFVKFMADSFAAETVIGPSHFKKINANFNEFKGNLHEWTITVPSTYLSSYQKLLAKIMDTAPTESEREKLLADLIHMHVNRLFSADQRMYETIIYHYFLRILQTIKATSKAI